MENYYKKYKIWSLQFGAYYSGNQYVLPSNTLSEIEFNRFNNPYYIDFLHLPKTGKISFINHLEPIFDRVDPKGTNKVYTLPNRTDTITVDYEKLKAAYETRCSANPSGIINYFGNNLTFKLNSPDLNNNEWSGADDLVYLINKLNYQYSGNINQTGFNSNSDFYGKGYLLQNCSGCVDSINLNTSLVLANDCTPSSYDLKSFTINLNYNPYNLINANADILVNSERIPVNDLSFQDYISFITNDPIFDGCFSISKSIQNDSNYSDENYLPLLFRTLNLNSKKLIPFVENEYYNTLDINQSGADITSYKYVPNLECDKLAATSLINIDTILAARNISLKNYSNRIYSALISGIEPYEYGVSSNNHLPEIEQISEQYIKYYDTCNNYNLSPRRPVQIRLTALPITNLDDPIAAYSYLGYSMALNRLGDIGIATATNSTENNISGAGRAYLLSGQGNSWYAIAKITGQGIGSGDQFGSSVAINDIGNIVCVGAYNSKINNITGAGAVYIFTGYGTGLNQATRITGSGNQYNDYFGSSVSLNGAGNLTVVGAAQANNGSGAAYIFTGTQANWIQVIKLTGINNRKSGDLFGASTDINNVGNTIIIGSPNSDYSSGVAFIFTGSNNTWNQTARITSTDIKSGDRFGTSVSINSLGNIALIGAPGVNNNSGVAYIFTGSGNNWIQTAKLTTSDGLANDRFGSSVSLNGIGNIGIIGAYNASVFSTSGVGMIYTYTGSGINWAKDIQLTNLNTLEYFGWSTAINYSGNIKAIGAPGAFVDNQAYAGTYYISSSDKKCPPQSFLNQDSPAYYSIPNIKVQLDAMDSLSMLSASNSLLYWKNKVNFAKGYNNLYNSGDAISYYSNTGFSLINIKPFSGLVRLNNVKNGDFLTLNDISFNYSDSKTGFGFFSGITGLRDAINTTSSGSHDLLANILNNNTLSIFTSGVSTTYAYDNILITNYLTGQNHGVVYYPNQLFRDNDIINFYKISNDIQKIYSCSHSRSGELEINNQAISEFIQFQNFQSQTFQKECIFALLKNKKITGLGTNCLGRVAGVIANDSNDIFTGDWNNSPVGKLTGVIDLAVGPDFAFALLDNNRITGWGNDAYGQVSQGLNLTGVLKVSAGSVHAIALLKNNTITGWGNNGYLQVSPGLGLTGVSGISAGSYHNLAILINSGIITGWGDNSYGQISAGLGLISGIEISAGKFHSLAVLKNQNRATGWGFDYFNQLTKLHNITKNITLNANNVVDIDAGYQYALGILSTSGKVTGWGYDDYGKISQGLNLTGVIKISAGLDHSLAVLSGGKVTGWGNDTYGQASYGNNLTNVLNVSAGDYFSLALLSNGAVTGWGYDNYGQASNANNFNNVIKISAGSTHGLALFSNGTVTGWGEDTDGKALNGNNLVGVVDISAGLSHSLALFYDGTVTGWGNDELGEISLLSGITGASGVSAGNLNSLILLNNNTISGFGSDDYGKTYDGIYLTGVFKMSAGFDSSIALLKTNKVTGWGNPDSFANLISINIIKDLGPTGISGINAGINNSCGFSGNNNIVNWGVDQLNFNSVTGERNVNAIKSGIKYTFTPGVNFSAFIVPNYTTGSIEILNKSGLTNNNTLNNLSSNGLVSSNISSFNMTVSNLGTFGNLESGYFEISGIGYHLNFSNEAPQLSFNDLLLPKIDNQILPSIKFINGSNMLISGYNGKLPISIFFIESGNFGSNQKSIQSYNNSGFYMSTLNTGKFFNFTGIGDPTRINSGVFGPFGQIGNLIMDTGSFRYYINNILMYSGNTGFNFGQISIGSNDKFIKKSIQSKTYPIVDPSLYYTESSQGLNGGIIEMLIYDSGLSDLNRNEVYFYLNEKWNNIYNYYPHSTSPVYYTENIVKNTKTNCTDCSRLLNNLPKENQSHILLLEYNLYGYSDTLIDDCDMDMHCYILNSGLYEDSKKEPLVSNLTISYVSGEQKSISNINVKSQNIYNVCDFNFGASGIAVSQDRLKSLKSNLELKAPNRTYCTGEYLKYPKVDGNGT
jgi:alpha-tubulin suppressor-like RCC1 family protein